MPSQSANVAIPVKTQAQAVQAGALKDTAIGRSTVPTVWFLVAAAVFLGACSRSAERLPLDRIVFVTIDTLRADHLPMFGYPVNTAPFLKSLAERSVSFKKAFSHSATTGPSHASMFTSLYPLQHRVQNNGQKLADRFVTLAEILRDRGFETAAFVSGMAQFGQSHIAQGFRTYNEPAADVRNDKGRPIFFRPADETTEAVIDWLKTRGAREKFFLWVHYYDLHEPAQPPRAYVDQVEPRDDAELKQLVTFLSDQHDLALQRPRQIREIIRYDAAIRFVDAQIERLAETFNARGFGSKSLWVITSDHGQGLGNHAWFGHHRNIYNEQVHVPLIVHAGGGELRAGIVDDQIVEHVDIPVTILDLIGAQLDGQPAPVQGQSLAPVLFGDRTYRHKRLAFSERRRVFRDRSKVSDEPGERYALQTLERKYVLFSEGPDEFYNLADDPYERRNLVDEPGPQKELLKTTLTKLVSTLNSNEPAEIVDEETLERLKALGYAR